MGQRPDDRDDRPGPAAPLPGRPPLAAHALPAFRYDGRRFSLEVFDDRVEVWDGRGVVGALTGGRWTTIPLAAITGVGVTGGPPRLRIRTAGGAVHAFDLGAKNDAARLAIQEMR